jgi:hypothetical protein
MKKIIDYLEGKRTIITAVATAIWTALWQQGIITDKAFHGGVVAGGCLMAIFLRLAMLKQSQPGITVLHPVDVKPTAENLNLGGK